MKSVYKDTLLESLEKRVEGHLKTAIEIYQNMDEYSLNKPAPNGGWSIAQCLEHLNTYGNYYLPEIEKGLNGYKGASNLWFTSSWLGNYFTNMMDPDRSAKKYRSMKGHDPSFDLPAREVVANFITQQERLIQCLRLAHGVNINVIRIPTSIFRLIRLKLGDVFGFIIVHNERHVRQANRLLSSYSSFS